MIIIFYIKLKYYATIERSLAYNLGVMSSQENLIAEQKKIEFCWKV